MRASVLLCEGAHDQEFLRGILIQRFSFRDFTGDSEGIPPPLRLLIPEPRPGPRGTTRTSKSPSFLVAGELHVAIASRGNDRELLNSATAKLLTPILAELDSLAIVVDANATGVANRVQAVTTNFLTLTARIANLPAGAIENSGLPRIGFFVAPDNQAHGSMNSVILESARAMRPVVASAADAFVEAAGVELQGFPEESQLKARLGCIAQADDPAGSLSTALHKSPEKWVAATGQSPKLDSLCEFLRLVMLPAPAAA